MGFATFDHWREFGPEHGFDECLERNASLLDAQELNERARRD